MNGPCNVLLLYKYALQYVNANIKGTYLLIIQGTSASTELLGK